jgi:hypothetical protein
MVVWEQLLSAPVDGRAFYLRNTTDGEVAGTEGECALKGDHITTNDILRLMFRNVRC